MTINEMHPVVSRDYESELEQLKLIYEKNRKVEKAVIDFTNQNLVANALSVAAYVTGNTGKNHAK